MNEIKIQVLANRKLSKKVVDIGNMQENKVTKLIFELEEDIVTLGGNVYLFVSYDGSTYPYPLRDSTFEIGRELTQRKKVEANVVVSDSDNSENLLEGVMWISNTLTLVTDKNSINVNAINETELPPSLKIVYDDLLNLEKDLKEKRDSDYWRGEKGDKGDAGSIEFIVVDALPQENIKNAIYLVPSGDEEQNKFLEYIYVDGAWECIGSATVEVDLSEYVKKTDYATTSGEAGLVVLNKNKGVFRANLTPQLEIVCAQESEIDGKTSQYKPIVPLKLDYAVMKALTDSKNHEWTDDEKALARALLGAVGSSDIASENALGLVRINRYNGIRVNEKGEIFLDSINEIEINKKQGANAVKCSQIDKAVKSGLAYCLLEWTEEEKASALELLGAIPMISQKNRILAVNSSGEVIGMAYNSEVQASTFAYRNKDGNIGVGTPLEDTHATPKKYVDDNFVGKVTDTSTMNRVYGIGHSGTDTVVFVLSSGGINNLTIPLRNADGQFNVGTPTEDLHVVNKKYVDEVFVAIQNPEFDSGATRGYVYFIDHTGKQDIKAVQIQNGANTIPVRNPNGNFYVSTPTLQYECTNKGYVDGLIAELRAEIEALKG